MSWVGTSFGVGVRLVDLSPSINFLTVSDIFGCGEDFDSWGLVVRFRDISGTLGTGAGLGMSGRLRFRDSSILEFCRVLGDVLAGRGFLNGVTSLNDGRAGMGITAG